MASKHVTISDIASSLGLTPSTVSRALAANPRVSSATRQKVHEAARLMGYQPNVMASALRRGTSDTVGVVVPRINRHFFSHVISGVEALLNPAGYNLLISQTNELLASEKRALRTLLGNRVGAIAISHSVETHSFEHLMEVADAGIPLVQFDRVAPSVPGIRVVNDNFSGALSATRQLIKAGCRRIIHLAGALHTNIYNERHQGYRFALEEAGLEYDPALVIEDCITREAGFGALEQNFTKSRADGLFAASDYSALGAINWLKTQQVSIPGDMRVAGFANEPFSELIDPSLSSVEQNAFEMGNKIAQVITSHLRGEELAAEEITVPVRLIVRESSSLPSAPSDRRGREASHIPSEVVERRE